MSRTIYIAEIQISTPYFYLLLCHAVLETITMPENNDYKAPREIKYPEIKQPRSEKFVPLRDLPDEKKFDYKYWESFLTGNKRKFRWQILLVPVLIFLIAALYRYRFDQVKVPLLRDFKNTGKVLR